MITKPVPALLCAPTGHNPTSRTTPELATALFLEQGVELVVLKELLGHARIGATTAVYANTSDYRQRRHSTLGHAQPGGVRTPHPAEGL